MSKNISTLLAESGIPGVGPVPYGLHLCHFYSGKQDLIDSLVPYFKAGLENNERCIWVTAPPLPAAEAHAELAKALPGAGKAAQSGILRILDADRWYADVAGGDVLRRWLAEEEDALAKGFRGLRITGNTSFLKQETWNTFIKYESALNRALPNRRVITLCSYDLRQCRSTDLFDVIRHHHHTLCRAANAWEIVDRDGGLLAKAIDS